MELQLIHLPPEIIFAITQWIPDIGKCRLSATCTDMRDATFPHGVQFPTPQEACARILRVLDADEDCSVTYNPTRQIFMVTVKLDMYFDADENVDKLAIYGTARLQYRIPECCYKQHCTVRGRGKHARECTDEFKAKRDAHSLAIKASIAAIVREFDNIYKCTFTAKK